jgi:hypothetical protein
MLDSVFAERFVSCFPTVTNCNKTMHTYTTLTSQNFSLCSPKTHAHAPATKFLALTAFCLSVSGLFPLLNLFGALTHKQALETVHKVVNVRYITVTISQTWEYTRQPVTKLLNHTEKSTPVRVIYVSNQQQWILTYHIIIYIYIYILSILTKEPISHKRTSALNTKLNIERHPWYMLSSVCTYIHISTSYLHRYLRTRSTGAQTQIFTYTYLHIHAYTHTHIYI